MHSILGIDGLVSEITVKLEINFCEFCDRFKNAKINICQYTTRKKQIFKAMKFRTIRNETIRN